jgi:hypothetical protein
MSGLNMPFIVGFSGHTTALVFYLIVGAGGLVATLATRFGPRMPVEREMTLRMAAYAEGAGPCRNEELAATRSRHRVKVNERSAGDGFASVRRS